MNQSAFNRIDLPIVKHHFALDHALDVDRKDRVASGFGAKDGSQITGRSDGGNSVCATIESNVLTINLSSFLAGVMRMYFMAEPED